MESRISIILPSHNEADSLATLLPELIKIIPDAEILVVDDGSTDETLDVCHKHKVISVSHPYKIGNGAAIKTGARAASGDIFIFMDADGQHSPDDIHKLLDEMNQGYDMVVGGRAMSAHAGIGRAIANTFYNLFASWVVGHIVKDLTSGFRVVKADKFREFLQLLPNGFSYPTSITMAFFRSGYSVKYFPIDIQQREGKSHLKPLKDGVKFLLIIFKIGTLYSPLKFFFPVSLVFFITGISYYLYTFLTAGRFTNMGALLLTTSILVFLIGLVSEQLTMLFYRDKR